jgi:DNA-binding GntR family transcriptional regulator
MSIKIDKTFHAIREQLLNGELKVGDRVSEQGLAEQIGVSRSPVREAIKRLQHEGYFEQVHRYGTIVREPSLDEVSHAYELRAAIEPYAILNAQSSAYDECLPELRKLAGALQEVAEASVQHASDRQQSDGLVEEFFRLDERFHERLLECSGNDRFCSLVSKARLFTQIHTVERHSTITFETVMGVYRFHSRILDGIEAGDREAAAAVMLDHIHLSRDGAMDWLRFKASQQNKSKADRSAD